MTTEIMTRWVEALRSGKYAQGDVKCRSVDNRYCPLGVLCETLNIGQWVKPTEDSQYYLYDVPDDKSTEWDSAIPRNPLFMDVMQMNKDGKSFSHIANYIEASRNC